MWSEWVWRFHLIGKRWCYTLIYSDFFQNVPSPNLKGSKLLLLRLAGVFVPPCFDQSNVSLSLKTCNTACGLIHVPVWYAHVAPECVSLQQLCFGSWWASNQGVFCVFSGCFCAAWWVFISLNLCFLMPPVTKASCLSAPALPDPD